MVGVWNLIDLFIGTLVTKTMGEPHSLGGVHLPRITP
jgi:hypothetical protein